MASIAEIIAAINQLTAEAEATQGILHAALEKVGESQQLALSTFDASTNEAIQAIQGTLNSIGEDVETLQKKLESVKELGAAYKANL
jgi:methyl-accepting chemotaxis protein